MYRHDNSLAYEHPGSTDRVVSESRMWIYERVDKEGAGRSTESKLVMAAQV